MGRLTLSPGLSPARSQAMLDFLRGFKAPGGESLLLSSRVNSVQRLRHALLRAERLLDKHEDEVRFLSFLLAFLLSFFPAFLGVSPMLVQVSAGVRLPQGQIV